MTRLLITGGSGFLGRRLGKHFKERGYNVTLAARNAKANLLASQFSECPCLPLDVTNLESVRDIVNVVKPDIIIHAAATKFVSLAENQPLESVDINIVGSQNVARVAIDKGVQCVIGISTDKASPPVGGIYGLSKATMERLFANLDDKTDTRFISVRYGNVTWSTGSVLTIWRKRLKAGQVLGLTGSDYLRFFFSVDEAINLIQTAVDIPYELYGSVLARSMKSCSMEQMLKVWQAHEPALQYERTHTQGGERLVEYLYGETEMPYTTPFQYKGIPHFAIKFNQISPSPVTQVLSSENADRLTDDEIWQLINSPPDEEI